MLRTPHSVHLHRHVQPLRLACYGGDFQLLVTRVRWCGESQALSLQAPHSFVRSDLTLFSQLRADSHGHHFVVDRP